MHNIYFSINQIFSEWDPIGVGESISSVEYERYLPRIMKCIENKEELGRCLQDILINDLEVGYDINNENHTKMMDEIINKLQHLKV